MTGGVSISSLTWTNGTTKNITSITNASEGVITISSSSDTSGIADGDWIYISGVTGMTQINGKIGQIASLNTTAKTFKLKVGTTNLCTTNGCGYSNYSTSSTDNFQKCLIANCLEVVTTSAAHGSAWRPTFHSRRTAPVVTGARSSSSIRPTARLSPPASCATESSRTHHPTEMPT